VFPSTYVTAGSAVLTYRGISPRGDAPIGEANLHAKVIKCRKSAESATAT
jgi:hypothetical protein